MWFNLLMRPAFKLRTAIFTLPLLICSITPASAHQPVNLSSANSTADRGPILVDGTISFAIRANFTKANQTQGFRASLKAGELVNFEYLIVDKAPEK